MKKYLSLPFLTCIIIFSFSCSRNKANIELCHLKSEYLTNPIGIDTYHPRFTWQITTNEQALSQRACQIIVDTSLSNLKSGKGNIWNSGKLSRSKIPVVYDGEKLQPFTLYYWRVRIKDNNNRWSDYSPPGSFETGMMHTYNWRGSWISDTHDYDLKPAPYFRKEFSPGKKLKSARAYIAVGGLYELYLNGDKVGDHRLDPMYTRFDRRTLYVTYDVTEMIKEGKNAMGVILGNGWYNHQSTAVWFFDQAPWRARPKFCMDLKLFYEDGTSETISTDQTWRTSLSPVIFNSIYTAEHYDARLQQAGWNTAGFDDTSWKLPTVTGPPSKNITAQQLHPIRNIQEIQPQSITKFSNQNYVVDFGRNIAGVTRLKIKGKAGTKIRLKHGERLYNNGHVDLSNIDIHYRPTDDSDPFQTDIVILSGKEDEFMPKFNYKGFQYVEVTSDQPIEFSKDNLVAYFMHSDVPWVGSIHSSNEILNKIWMASNASYLSNLFGIPTDCPQREKNGWTGDAHINIETGLYNFDAISIYEKWMADHRDEQQPNGVFPSIIPSDGWGYSGSNGPDWTSSIAIIPWNIYLFYGDTQILNDCYPNIKLYVDHITSLYPEGITDWGLGDWVPVKSKANKALTSTAYYYTDAVILAKSAKILGKERDAEKYSALAGKIKKAFNNTFLNHETGIYASGLQTELSVPLFWNLVPATMIEAVSKNLAERVEADGGYIDVGLLGTKAILNALSENGFADLAYQVASKKDFPSWGWWIVNGATTFYENWDPNAESDISMNHIMFGEINAWYYKALGGIFPDEENPGFKNIILRPHFVEGLEHFKATHESLYGEIVSSWERTGDQITYIISIPANSTATLFLHDMILLNEAGETETGKVKGVEIVRNVDNAPEIKLSSGKFNFRMKQINL